MASVTSDKQRKRKRLSANAQSSNSDPYRRIFPLYMNAFEKFMQADDREDYPMCFVITMEFSGQLQSESFERALAASLDRHRILQSLIAPAKKDRLCWVHHPEMMPEIDYGTFDDPIEADSDTMDLKKELGLRIWVRQNETDVDVTFYFHHSCVDGIAGHRFIGDLFAIYHNLVTGEETAKLGDLKPALLKDRGRRQSLAGASADHPHTQWYAWKYLFKTAIWGSSAVRTPKKQKWSKNLLTPRFGVYKDNLDKEEYKQLRDAAVQLGVTVNDVLVSQIFQTFFEWNKIQKGGSCSREVRILMPVDLRSRGDEEMPSANMASYNFITRKPKQLSEAKSFVQDIRDETAAIKTKGMGSAFISAITNAMVRPWIFDLALNKSRGCLASVVLTNVGDPTRRYISALPRKKGAIHTGGLVMKDCTGCPPIRSKTNVSIAITTYLRQLTVGIRCDPHYFDEATSKEILAMYMAGLRKWIADFAST